MITPRATRLVRVADLHAFREAVVALALEGPPLAARDRLVVVPTRAAAAQLQRSIEDTLPREGGGCLLPDLITPDEIVGRLADRLPRDAAVLTEAERDVLLGVSCRAARATGEEPPFRLRPGLVAAMLRFYDALRRNQKDVDTFERLVLGVLEPGASFDRGAERLVRQTRFLAAAFRDFERRCAEAGADEHALRRELLRDPAPRPVRHVVLTVADRGVDPHGLAPADWDLLARLPGLERLDLVITDRMLAGPLHERIHQLLPGIEEVRHEAAGQRAPVLGVTGAAALVYSARDREEEVSGFARRVKALVRTGDVPALDRVALVVRQPLPYVYLARGVLRSGGIPCQLFDALPLAAEPYAAALDLVVSLVSSGFARAPAIALLHSPHFRFVREGGESVLAPREVAALDRLLSESGYLGDPAALDRLVAGWEGRDPRPPRTALALRAAVVLQGIAGELRPLCSPAPVADHLQVLIAFLSARESLPGPDDPVRARQLRARAAIIGTLAALRDAYRRFDPTPVDADATGALVRRWIESQTFAPRRGESGVHVIDAASAPFGAFDHVQLAGLVDGEWPDRPHRNIFYSASILRDLGWPAEAERIDGARAAFADLLRLPSRRLAVSTFLLESDALVSPSPLLDELREAQLPLVEEPGFHVRIFDHEALALDPISEAPLTEAAREWARFRTLHAPLADGRYQGATAPHTASAWSLSALERYQDCPFRFFAADVLRLEEAPEDEEGLSPRARGRFVHEVLQRFFEAWDARGARPLGPDGLDEARELFREVAEPLLSRLPEADAALERTRLFGSAISAGMADVMLGLEAARPAEVRERWLEHRFHGAFSLGDPGGGRVSLKGVADRVDVLAGNRLRVIDYKTGSAPNPKRALQVPIYALCARELLQQRTGSPWAVDEAAYLAFSGPRTFVPIVRPGGAEAAGALAAARARVTAVVDGIARGEFPPRPHDPAICRYCAYAAVCRKDYVDDE